MMRNEVPVEPVAVIHGNAEKIWRFGDRTAAGATVMATEHWGQKTGREVWLCNDLSQLREQK